MVEYIVAVDKFDKEIGFFEKMEAHYKELFLYLYLIPKINYCYRKDLGKNIILLGFGVIPAGAILDMAKIYKMKFIKDLKKKWALHVNLKRYLVLFIR